MESPATGSGAAEIVSGLSRVVDGEIEARFDDLVERLSVRIAAEVSRALGGGDADVIGNGKGLLTVLAAARYLSLSRSTVYELIRRGELESVRVCGARGISIEALETFRSKLDRGSPPSPGPSAGRRAPAP